jgi:hypothetical protein
MTVGSYAELNQAIAAELGIEHAHIYVIVYRESDNRCEAACTV